VGRRCWYQKAESYNKGVFGHFLATKSFLICHSLRRQGKIHLVTIQRLLQRYQIEQSLRDHL
jgi:hypothetical protein